jgi:superfamily II RNA helicase
MSSQYVKIITNSEPIPEIPSDLALKTSYEPDRFQKFAIHAIVNKYNVLVTAPTGSGKTYVGEYQIAHSLREGKRVFYTTPIKSLSNQKFHDLKSMFPEPGMVGIMTGDIKFCPDAKVIVMTTEILRNLLYKKGTATEHVGLTSSLSLQDLGAVVFDECHYINDRDRGKVWEETMILLPREVQLIMLSATLDRPELFAAWIGELKQTPCHLIQTHHRIVPLTHSILRGRNLYTLMDSKEVFDDANYSDWLRVREQTEKEHEAYQRKVANARRSGFEGPVGGKVKPVSFSHQLNRCVDQLQEQGLLPALVFVLSRKGCEHHASKTEATLLDTSDATVAERIFDFHLKHHKTSLETLSQYHTLRSLVKRGIAFHHSGVLPLLKEIIEILFTKGYIKLLYCTETFAVGINMPTKTVIFTGLTKYDDATEGMRLLRTDEYIQMAGRAGRRGKDKFGQVIYLPERDPVTTAEMRLILKGGRPEIKSRMDFHYDFLLKTLQIQETKWMEIQNMSYWKRQNDIIQDSMKRELEDLKRTLSEITITKDVEEELAEKAHLEELIRTTGNAKRKDAMRKLDRWNEDHMGPNWKIAEENLKKKEKLSTEIKGLESSILEMSENTGNVMGWLEILKDLGFLKEDNTLTEKGVLATEFNEGHSLVCSEFFTRGFHKNLSGSEILSILACFMEEKETESSPTLDELQVSKPVYEALCKIQGILEDMMNCESKHRLYSPNEYWSLTTTWIEPIQRWLDGENMGALCGEYGIFEGNFVRAVLRVANMVDEWIAIATLSEDLETLEKLSQIKPNLVRDIIVPDSLYLHI